MAKNGWKNLVGTVFSSFRLGFTGVRIKDVSGVLQVRNSGDTADANLKAALLQLSGGTPGAGKVLTSDASGNGTWGDPQPAIDSRIDAALPDNIVLFHLQDFNLNGTGLAFTLSTTYTFNHVLGMTPPANADSWQQSFTVAAGTYQLVFWGIKASNSGKLDIYVDNVLQGTLDFYNATTLLNTSLTMPGVVVSAGRHTLKCTVNGKNASSSAFNIFYTYVHIHV
jgi:hypothetical protein